MRDSVPGKLSHEIIFLENITNSDLEDENWVEKSRAFAEIRPLYDNKFGSIENFTFGHIVTENFFMFKIRYFPDVSTKMRIQYQERNFEIKRIINLSEQNQFLQIISLEI